jgi:hypothetical protein
VETQTEVRAETTGCGHKTGLNRAEKYFEDLNETSELSRPGSLELIAGPRHDRWRVDLSSARQDVVTARERRQETGKNSCR